MAGELWRWLFGTVLVTWRYMWMTTPLRRSESPGWSDEDLPPKIPDGLLDERLQLAATGVGPVFHRRFRVRVGGSGFSAQDLLAWVVEDFARFVPREVVGIHDSPDGALRVGDEFVVKMPGPWDGPVRVVHLDDHCLRLATLEGHLEAGQVQFRTEEQGDVLGFEVEAWARPATRLVHLLYARMRLAKEIQLNMWVRFCLAAARACGRPLGGVEISTRWVPEEAIPVERNGPHEPGRVGGRLR